MAAFDSVSGKVLMISQKMHLEEILFSGSTSTYRIFSQWN